jgi:hypothetical protein
MQRSAFRMTRGQWIAGSLVFLLTILCGILSARWAERVFAPPPATESGKGAEGTHTRTCITLGGKRFEWNFPNPPFGTLSCSD